MTSATVTCTCPNMELCPHIDVGGGVPADIETRAAAAAGLILALSDQAEMKILDFYCSDHSKIHRFIFITTPYYYSELQ